MEKVFFSLNIWKSYNEYQKKDDDFTIKLLIRLLCFFSIFFLACFPCSIVCAESDTFIEWNRTYEGFPGENNAQTFWCVQQTTDGGFIAVGDTHNFLTRDSDIFLLKANSSGKEQWRKTYGGSFADDGYYIQQTNDGGFIITGGASFNDSRESEIYLLKTDPDGNARARARKQIPHAQDRGSFTSKSV